MNDIEREVREMLRTKVVEAPVRDEPPPVVLRRTRTLRAVNGVGIMAAAAAVVLGVVFGVQTFGDGDVVEPDAPIQRVPWTDTQAPIDDRELPPCRAQQLSVSAGVSTLGGQLDFVLRGKEPCRLYPDLRLSLLDDRGREVEGVFALVGYTNNLYPGTRAPVAFTVLNDCAVDVASFKYQVRLESNEILSVRPTRILAGPSAGRPCDGDVPPRLDFFSGPPVALGEAGREQLGFSLNAPAIVAAGGVLRYEVTITNPTRDRVRLAPCPVFRQTLSGAGTIRPSSHVLNCVAAGGSIPAGGRVTFEMEMNIDGLSGANYVLWWGIDTLNSHLRQIVVVR